MHFISFHFTHFVICNIMAYIIPHLIMLSSSAQESAYHINRSIYSIQMNFPWTKCTSTFRMTFPFHLFYASTTPSSSWYHINMNMHKTLTFVQISHSSRQTSFWLLVRCPPSILLEADNALRNAECTYRMLRWISSTARSWIHLLIVYCLVLVFVLWWRTVFCNGNEVHDLQRLHSTKLPYAIQYCTIQCHTMTMTVEDRIV